MRNRFISIFTILGLFSCKQVDTAKIDNEKNKIKTTTSVTPSSPGVVSAIPTTTPTPIPIATPKIIDSIAPTVYFTMLPESATSNQTANIEFMAYEDQKILKSVECSLDGQTKYACSSPIKLINLPIGNHKFTVTVSDNASNTNTISTEFNIYAPLTLVSKSSEIKFGVNIHYKNIDVSALSKVSSILSERNFNTARVGMNYDSDPTVIRNQIIELKKQGIVPEVPLFTSHQWISKCDLNLDTAYNDAYNQTLKMVNSLKDLVTDFELTNEISLRSELRAEVETNSTNLVSSYTGKPCYTQRAKILKGMVDAIKSIRLTSGLPLRIILGTVGRDFAFLRYMQENGVDFDLVGYHIYPLLGHKTMDVDTWFGAGGLFTQLAQFNKSVHLNEFHCAEIYNASFDNLPGSSLSEDCYKSMKKHLDIILNQKTVKIESLIFYELLDEPLLKAPENHFGLMYDLDHPKLDLALTTMYTGGKTTDSEKTELSNRNLFLFPDLVIDNVKLNMANPKANDLVTFSATIMNKGTKDLLAGTKLPVNFYVNDLLITSGSVIIPQNLAPNATIVINANEKNLQGETYFKVITPATNKLKAVVNEQKTIDELNNSNNIFNLNF